MFELYGRAGLSSFEAGVIPDSGFSAPNFTAACALCFSRCPTGGRELIINVVCTVILYFILRVCFFLIFHVQQYRCVMLVGTRSI